MKRFFRAGSVLLVICGALAAARLYNAADLRPEIKFVSAAKLPGGFVSPQALYADSERIFACSFQGDLFVLARDRQTNFPLIQTIRLSSPLTAVRGDANFLYVSSADGNLYMFAKTWPLQFVKSVPVSYYGLSAVEVVGSEVYVAKGQAAMAASDTRVYLSQLNEGDIGVEYPTMRSYGEQFVPDVTRVFDRVTLQQVGTIPHGAVGINVKAWQDFVYLTTPGCCGAGIDVYDARRLTRLQFINRSANTVVGTKRKGLSLMVGGSESGVVDLFLWNRTAYNLSSSVDLRSVTGFSGPEDIEIRAMWTDGIDSLVFAASSWGNATRPADLPSFFVLEIR